jgi:hypothetical protein
MAWLDFSNTNTDPQQSSGSGGLLNNPLALTGMMLLAQQDESVAQMLPSMMQMQQTQALNQYRQQQAAHQAKEYDLQERKYNLDASRQQQEVTQEQEKQQRYKTAEQRLAELRGNKGQAPEQAGAIFNPDSTIYKGSGYEGGQLTAEQLAQRQAEVMAGLGDTRTAGNLYTSVNRPYTLSPGQVHYDASGKIIAQGANPQQVTLNNELVQADVKTLQDAQEAANSAQKIRALLTEAREITANTSDFALGPIAENTRANKLSGNVQRLQQIRGLVTPLLRTMLSFPASGFSEGDRQMLVEGALNTGYDRNPLLGNIDTLLNLTSDIENKAQNYRGQLQSKGRIDYNAPTSASQSNQGQEQPKRFKYNLATGRLE